MKIKQSTLRRIIKEEMAAVRTKVIKESRFRRKQVGAAVIDDPDREDCTECDGQGVVAWGPNDFDCDACEGTGKVGGTAPDDYFVEPNEYDDRAGMDSRYGEYGPDIYDA